MTTSILLVGGVRELGILFLTFTSQSATMPLGYVTELLAALPPLRDEDDPKKRAWGRGWWARMAPFLVGLYVHLPTWIVFLFTFYDSVAKAAERFDRSPPPWVYAIVWSQFLLFTSFTIPIFVYQTFGGPNDYWQTEVWYSVLSLAAKLVLNGLLLANVFIVGRLDLS